jgi:peroxin-13
MGGYGGMGMGLQPPGYDHNNPSLTQQLEATTQSTFALLQSIVQTFGGFAQMLESTYMATHSSFFAMVGVADQFGQLRNALGTVLGLFGAVRWLKRVITGRSADGMTDEFGNFLNRPPGALPPNPNAPKPGKKPIIFFLLAVLGIPYLMHRLIRHLSMRLPPPTQHQVLDPSKLVFARAAFAFETKDPVELALREGEMVAVLGTTDPVTGVEGEWWRGRTREGREGWFPKAYVEVLGTPGTGEAKKVV